MDLTYAKKSSIKNPETSLYKTDFILSVHRPPGNFQTQWNFLNHISFAECSDYKWTGTEEETGGGIASTTIEYEISCTTQLPVVNNHNLFELE